MAGKQLTPDEAAIAAKVSDYATDDPREFVAETFAVLATGGTVSADIMALYTALGGQKP